MNRNIFRILMCTVTAVVAVTATTGAASTPPTVPHHTSPVSIAMHALVAESADAASRAIPADFASVMGYRPKVLDAVAENPGGGCSSPVPLPPEFESPCRAHDLGYDLIRYAAATGTAVDPHWRRSIDDRLESRMHAACTERTEDGPRRACDVAASMAAAAVASNSWRQSYRAPVAEPALPIALTGAAFALIALCALVTSRYLSGRLSVPETGGHA